MKINDISESGKYLIVYHREDNDGLFSMALLYQHLLHVLKVRPEDIDLFGADYDMMSKADINDWLKTYSNILMTDISLPIDKMKKIADKFGVNFVWCDHHAPIINECNANGLSTIPGSRLIDRSAIWNVYDYLYNSFHLSFDDPGNKVRKPELLLCLSAFDSFTFDKWGYNKDYVTDIMEGCNIEFDLNPEAVIRYIDMYINGFESDDAFYMFNEKECTRFFNMGKVYLNARNKDIARHVSEYGSEFKVGNRKACAIVTVDMKGSDVFKSVKDEYQNGIIFKRLNNGRWVISLYNTDYEDESFHCGEYLKKHYKGGGHVGAAGAQIDEDVFFKILKSKKL